MREKEIRTYEKIKTNEEVKFDKDMRQYKIAIVLCIIAGNALIVYTLGIGGVSILSIAFLMILINFVCGVMSSATFVDNDAIMDYE